MLPSVPLPTWRDLLAAVAPGKGVLDPPTQPWVRHGDRAVWFSRGAWALAALCRAWAESHGRVPRLWLPDYYCEQALGPLREVVPEPLFYPVADSLEPDWPACAGLAARRSPDLFLLAHYFGRPCDAAAARRFCDSADALLIEDAAHVLNPVPGIGEEGDAVLYCPHKLLAIPDGAVLVLRSNAANALAEGARAQPWLWLAKRAAQISPAAERLARYRDGGPASFRDDPPPDEPIIPTPLPSRAGLALLGRMVPRLDDIAERRRRNATALGQALADRGDWRVLDTGAGAPYRLVLRCADETVAEAMFSMLRDAGLPVESWPDLPPEVKAAWFDHGGALRLRKTMLLLPVHQSLEPEALARAYWQALG